MLGFTSGLPCHKINMVKTYYQKLTKIKIHDKESPETHNESHGCIQLLFFVTLIQVKDMENYTMKVCFF